MAHHGKLHKLPFDGGEIEAFYWRYQRTQEVTDHADHAAREKRFCKEFGCRFLKKTTKWWLVFDNPEDMTVFYLRMASQCKG